MNPLLTFNTDTKCFILKLHDQLIELQSSTLKEAFDEVIKILPPNAVFTLDLRLAQHLLTDESE